MTVLEVVTYNSIRFGIMIGVFLVMDYYAWTGIRTYVTNYSWFGLARGVYFATSVITSVGFLVTIILFSRGEGSQSNMANMLMGLVFILTIPKLFFIGFLVFEDFFRLALLGLDYIKDFNSPVRIIARTRYISGAGLIVSGLVLLLIANGVFRNKYNYRVRKVNLQFTNLPAEFDGYKLVHISDVHAGSFDNKDKVAKGIEIINKLKPDAILFSGDMVNMRSDEFVPYIPVFAKLEAKDGKFAVLGNHDYGDYVRFKSKKEKWKNLHKLVAYEKQAGFNVLLDASFKISRGASSIYVAGVENWGHDPFPRRGNLHNALANVPFDAFVILLSHDPSHWQSVVSLHQQHVPLTLSGHTHGMQFGIDLPWFRWSPVQWKYPLWGGLYKSGDRKLYVNIGFGFIGLPGRVGMLPEITVITLKKSK